MIVMQVSPDELAAIVQRAVAEALAAGQPKPEPANDPTRRMARVPDLVALFRRSETTVTERVITHPTFPKPCQVTGTVNKFRTWWYDECVAWARDNPDLMPARRRPPIRKQHA